MRRLARDLTLDREGQARAMVTERTRRTRLFVYGSLCAPEVMAAVAGRRRACEEATSEGLRVVPMRDKPYPALLRDANATAAGRLYRTLSPREMRRLDAYEGRAYHRMRVRVRTARGCLCAFVYRMRPGVFVRLGEGAWDRAAFIHRHARNYVRVWRAHFRRARWQ